VDYGTSLIVAKDGSTTSQGDGTDVSAPSHTHRMISNQSLAPGIEVGKRMPSVKVLNQADARPWHFQELLLSNGRWRVVFFPGDISQPAQKAKLEHIGKAIDDSHSFLRRFTPPGANYDAVFEVLAVHKALRGEHTIFDFPEVFRTFDDVDGYDYSKIYVDEESYHEGDGKFYETFGIVPEGCAVILRPDQYVSYVGLLEDVAAIDSFFEGFMVSPLLRNGAAAAEKTSDVRIS
jgi:phenol 2-monooxygenase